MEVATDPRVPGLRYPGTSWDKLVEVATDPSPRSEISRDIPGYPGISLWR